MKVALITDWHSKGSAAKDIHALRPRPPRASEVHSPPGHRVHRAPLQPGEEDAPEAAEIVILFGLARRTANKSKKVSLFYVVGGDPEQRIIPAAASTQGGGDIRHAVVHHLEDPTAQPTLSGVSEACASSDSCNRMRRKRHKAQRGEQIRLGWVHAHPKLQRSRPSLTAAGGVPGGGQ